MKALSIFLIYGGRNKKKYNDPHKFFHVIFKKPNHVNLKYPKLRFNSKIPQESRFFRFKAKVAKFYVSYIKGLRQALKISFIMIFFAFFFKKNFI
jgi:hypothetical protein